MKSLIASICILGVVGMVVGVVVKAAGEASVAATVTAKLISVSVTPNAVDYGILGFGDSKSSTELPTPITFSATNDGNVGANFNVRGANATGVAWTLGATPGTNVFRHTITGSTPEQSLTLDSVFWTFVGAPGTQLFTTKFYMPTPGSTGAGQTASTSVTLIVIE